MSADARTAWQSAAIIAVGSELLTPARVDTNSLYLTGQLNSLGIDVILKVIAGDDHEAVASAFAHARSRADLVILTGGLGPTDDDVTREAVAAALDLGLREDPAIVASIQRRFAARGLEMPEINRRQALVPEGAAVLENENGTAPGLWLEQHSALLLPGPPSELKPMLEAWTKSVAQGKGAATPIHRQVLRITGRTESHAEEALQPFYEAWQRARPPVRATILAASGQIELHLSTRASASAARGALGKAAADVRAALGDDVVSDDGKSLEEVVGDLLRARGWTLAIAESCTGGLIASRLTDVPGSSDYLLLGVVSYSNASKIDVLSVPADLIEVHGAVSEPVAVAMATGARERAHAHVGLGITGIAGPGGGTARKPVGTVVVAVVAPDGIARVRTHRLRGDRTQIKWWAAQTALDQIRRMLITEGARA
ncbi:MAG TPA: competence/damage-inducible protein A [Vicinamibacterales bacterium]|jgi:nicotinamide-nucleotide amidase|nr:competence/damage-inducible protein A [Vicinamibacterales bacterium]